MTEPTFQDRHPDSVKALWRENHALRQQLELVERDTGELVTALRRERDAMLAVLEAAEHVMTILYVGADNFWPTPWNHLDSAITAARRLVPRDGPDSSVPPKRNPR